MLIRSDTCYVPMAANIIILQGEDEAYYYPHRSLYDQCVILRDQYIGLIPSPYKLPGFEGEYSKACDVSMKSVPEPLGILVPFLDIITDYEKLDSIDDMCGTTSSISMFTDFRKMFKVPIAARTLIRSSLSVHEEHCAQWNRFFAETPTFKQVYFGEAHTVRPAPIGSAEDSVGIVKGGGETVEVSYTGGTYDMDDLMCMLDTASEATEEEDEFGGSPTTEEVVEGRPKVEGGFVMLKGLK